MSEGWKLELWECKNCGYLDALYYKKVNDTFLFRGFSSNTCPICKLDKWCLLEVIPEGLFPAVEEKSLALIATNPLDICPAPTEDTGHTSIQASSAITILSQDSKSKSNPTLKAPLSQLTKTP